MAVSVENLKPRREILVQPSGTLRGPAHDSAYLRQSSVGRLRVLLNYLLLVLPQLAVVIGSNHLLAPAVRTYYTSSSTYYYFLYLIFFTLHPWVASIRPLMGTPEGYNY